ncbi:MAG: EAL domain-containing protein, partial [Planctomycetes bacterium]|nr:EAL domain-containing protein [Planctomycetota bacterium]
MNRPFSLLVVDDSEDDCLLALSAIERAGMHPEWRRVQDEPALRRAFAEREWNVVLLDHAMPRLDGARALAIVREVAPQAIPIVVSGSSGEERAVEAIRCGASDYILKDRLLRLPAAIQRELQQADERRARREVERRMREMSSRDAVTGLPNRSALEEAISARLVAANGSTPSFAVVVMELERFVAVRHAFGHSVSDDVLRLVARKIDAVRPQSSTLVSSGSHEFALLLEAADVAAALATCEAMCALLDEPLAIGGVPIPVEVTMGVAVHPGHGSHSSLLLRNASIAMRDARALGRSFAAYRPERETSESDELILLGELRAAIETDQIVLEYQAIVALRDGSISGAEALVRWDHPRRGRIPPGMFVPQAESCALITPLTKRILRTALEWTAAQPRGPRPPTTAVNVATRNLLASDFVATVRGELEHARLQPSRLELEITEGALMADPTRARAVLRELCDLGVKLAIDDFGTGYSSFAQL